MHWTSTQSALTQDVTHFLPSLCSTAAYSHSIVVSSDAAIAITFGILSIIISLLGILVAYLTLQLRAISIRIQPVFLIAMPSRIDIVRKRPNPSNSSTQSNIPPSGQCRRTKVDWVITSPLTCFGGCLLVTIGYGMEDRRFGVSR
jgi:hypothetical protein